VSGRPAASRDLRDPYVDPDFVIALPCSDMQSRVIHESAISGHKRPQDACLLTIS
jgi:hypothetical protein